MTYSKQDLEELITILARGINKANLKSKPEYLEPYRFYQIDYKKKYGKEYTGIRNVKI